MLLSQIEGFAEIAHQRNMRRAAAALSISQPARLLVRTGHSEEMLDLVVRGEVDLGIVRQLRDARVDARIIHSPNEGWSTSRRSPTLS